MQGVLWTWFIFVKSTLILSNMNLKILHHKGCLANRNFDFSYFIIAYLSSNLCDEGFLGSCWIKSRSILQIWTMFIVLLASISKLIESLCGCLTTTAGCTFFLRSGLSFFAVIKILFLRSREFLFLIQYHFQESKYKWVPFFRPLFNHKIIIA